MEIRNRMAKSVKLLWKGFTRLFLSVCVVISVGLVLPQNAVIPVEGATAGDWNPESFWHYPWGSSGTHKGVDIFARKGTNVVSATSGIVFATPTFGKGGKTVLVFGPKWRYHYYAHLDAQNVSALSWVWKGEVIGKVGDSGNAKGKPPHLHYSVVSMVPYPWLVDQEPQGWRKMWFLDPTKMW